jgi:flagellar assembly protein FliH
VKNLLYKNKTIQDKDITVFCMPVLRRHREPGDPLAASVSASEEHIEREAYEKGFTAGENAGFSMGEKKALVLTERLENIILELTELRKKIVRETEPQMVELAVDIAKKIILKELTLNPDEIVNMTKEALLRLERTGQITIKINASLYELFMKHKQDILNIHPDVAFDVDPTAPAHGSVVMSPSEEIVTDVDVQIKHLIEEMGERFAGD